MKLYLLVFLFVLVSCQTQTVVVTATPSPTYTHTPTPTLTPTARIVASPTYPPGSCKDLAERFQYNTEAFDKCNLYDYGTFQHPLTNHVISSRNFDAPNGFVPFYTRPSDVFCMRNLALVMYCTINLSFYSGKVGYTTDVQLTANKNYFVKVEWSLTLNDAEKEYVDGSALIGAKVGSTFMVSNLTLRRTAPDFVVASGESVWAIRPSRSGVYPVSAYFEIPYGIFDANSVGTLSRIDVLEISDSHHQVSEFVPVTR